jgi:hypothetical protein
MSSVCRGTGKIRRGSNSSYQDRGPPVPSNQDKKELWPTLSLYYVSRVSGNLFAVAPHFFMRHVCVRKQQHLRRDTDGIDSTTSERH